MLQSYPLINKQINFANSFNLIATITTTIIVTATVISYDEMNFLEYYNNYFEEVVQLKMDSITNCCYND